MKQTYDFARYGQSKSLKKGYFFFQESLYTGNGVTIETRINKVIHNVLTKHSLVRNIQLCAYFRFLLRSWLCTNFRILISRLISTYFHTSYLLSSFCLIYRKSAFIILASPQYQTPASKCETILKNKQTAVFHFYLLTVTALHNFLVAK